MANPPLTHHDIIKKAAPLTLAGLKLNMPACDRNTGYLEFKAQAGQHDTVTVIHALDTNEHNQTRLTRIVQHESGLTSTLECIDSDLGSAIEALAAVPLKRQLTVHEHFVIAHSYTLVLDKSRNSDDSELLSRYICAHVAGLELRIDSSTGGGMPADVRLLAINTFGKYLPETLADGDPIPLHHRAAKAGRLKATQANKPISTRHLPDDLLAILGTQWRPLRYQGDHWKGVLRRIEKRETRTALIEQYIQAVVKHLQETLSQPPERYHETHSNARWRVYTRRLQPVMVFVGILALMPLSWLLVSSGTMTIHPLALGLTPLLMVGVVMLTAREIPVMEIPAQPTPLPSKAWHTDAPFASIANEPARISPVPASRKAEIQQ